MNKKRKKLSSLAITAEAAYKRLSKPLMESKSDGIVLALREHMHWQRQELVRLTAIIKQLEKDKAYLLDLLKIELFKK